MKPYTRDQAEEDLAAALASHDQDTALRIATELDRMPCPAPPSVPGAALWYARHGLPVFPIMPRSKVPYPKTRGVHDASTDPTEVALMFRGRPDSNVAIATGHRVDVIDFDGPEAHAAWGRVFGERWETAEVHVLATVSTPRPGGFHVYVPATGQGNRAGFVDHVDYRGVGGYVLAPPSSTELGTYRFLRPLRPETLP